MSSLQTISPSIFLGFSYLGLSLVNITKSEYLVDYIYRPTYLATAALMYADRMDSFSEDFVFYYWLKLKLLSRMRQFDKVSGEKAYKNIYNSILNGDRLEDIQ